MLAYMTPCYSISKSARTLWTCPHEVIHIIEIATVSSAVEWEGPWGGGGGGAGLGCVSVYKEEQEFGSVKPQH